MTFAGNYYNKYESGNPIVRWLMRNFLTEVKALVLKTGVTRVHEVGCGEGFLSVEMMRWGLQVRASDVSESVIEEARTRAQQAGLDIFFRSRGIEDLKPDEDSEQMVVCCEVFEHLKDPDAAARKLSQLAGPFLLCSVPQEPLWRILNVMRLKYLASFGNTPGHIQHWSSSGFIEFLQAYFDVLEVRFPMPWTLVLCRIRTC